MLTYVWAEVRHRLGRALGSLLGIALGVALFVALVAAGNGFREASRQPLNGIGADILISRPGGEGGAATQTTRGVRQPFGLGLFTVDEADGVRGQPGVAGVSVGLLLWDFSASSYQTLLGVDVTQTLVGPTRASSWVVDGRFIRAGETHVVVVDRHYAAFFGLAPGHTVDLGDQTFAVIGIVEVPGGNQAAAASFYLPLADAQSLAGLTHGQINQIYASVAEATDMDAVIAASQESLGEISAMTDQSIVQVMGGIAQVSDRFSRLAALAALLGGLILTAVTLSAGVNLRAVEIGVMRSSGWRTRDVMRVFAAEGVLVSLLGTAVGILLGSLAIMALGQIPIDMATPASTTPGLRDGVDALEYTLPARLTWDTVWLVFGLAVPGGGLASLWSARGAARIRPAVALRKQ